MNLRLRDNLFYCFCGGRAIFLDAETNRYWALPSKVEAVFRKVANGEAVEDGERQFLDALLHDGILLTSESRQQSWASVIPPPTCDLPRVTIEKPSFWLIGKVLRARWRARGIVNRHDIGSICRIIEQSPRNSSKVVVGPRDNELQRLRSAFEISDRLMSVRDQCLPRSLAMHVLSKQLGANSTTVLGVRINPFEAHCWVESDGAVITGDLEQAMLFTPIMRIS